jgi:tetratricopeptide (TPR) repeat protein
VLEDHSANELRELGESARQRRDLAAALRHYEEASRLLRGSPDQLKFAHTVRHLGDVYTEQAEFLRAEPCYIEALGIYRNHPSPPKLDLANAIRAYAVLMTGMGRQDESRPLWTEAEGLYKNLGIAEGSRNALAASVKWIQRRSRLRPRTGARDYEGVCRTTYVPEPSPAGSGSAPSSSAD